jgi:hypothetical protein
MQFCIPSLLRKQFASRDALSVRGGTKHVQWRARGKNAFASHCWPQSYLRGKCILVTLCVSSIKAGSFASVPADLPMETRSKAGITSLWSLAVHPRNLLSLVLEFCPSCLAWQNCRQNQFKCANHYRKGN